MEIRALAGVTADVRPDGLVGGSLVAALVAVLVAVLVAARRRAFDFQMVCILWNMATGSDFFGNLLVCCLLLSVSRLLCRASLRGVVFVGCCC